MCHFLCNKTFIGHISRQQVGRGGGGYIPQLWKYGTKSRPAASWMLALCSVMVCFESSLINFDLATPKCEGHPRSLRFDADSCGSGATAMWQCASNWHPLVLHAQLAFHVALAPFPWRILFPHKSKLSLSTLICFNDPQESPPPRLPLPSRTAHSLESVIGIYYKLISYFISGFVSAASEIMKKLFYGHIRFLRWWWAAAEEEDKEEGADQQQGPSLHLVSLVWPVSCHVPLSQKWHIKFNGNWWALIMIWDSLASYALSLLPAREGAEAGWLFPVRVSHFACFPFTFLCSCVCPRLFYHKSNFCWWSH